ncbi:hypothetical protein [Amycolatopsis sp. FDAARGOS 1241]|uniref:hypothetical protein n=1 Tax=Amycolatopsis sp. FDAARGOS 1241 TaxID=2778070 RepID=UPI001950EC38|nr:hypothetical protein [Amycolatopsis sp. FDAARGOS 1241]QRP43548.1 hypothetical protein I6J71_29670 [Amycolatopsis sp. FDAARGOS 1241]
MIGFETDLDDLRKASGFVADAGDAASAAAGGVKKEDVPEAAGVDAILGAVTPFGGGPTTAFGRTLGMRSVAAAYEYHRQKVQEALEKLAYSTHESSVALQRVAEIYEAADENAQAGLRRVPGWGA